MNCVIGVAYSVTFTLQVDDYQFNEYQENHVKAKRIIMGLTSFLSMHAFRLFYSRLFKLTAFHATATVPHEFIRPLQFYTKLHACFIIFPTFMTNLLGTLLTFNGFWDN